MSKDEIAKYVREEAKAWQQYREIQEKNLPRIRELKHIVLRMKLDAAECYRLSSEYFTLPEVSSVYTQKAVERQQEAACIEEDIEVLKSEIRSARTYAMAMNAVIATMVAEEEKRKYEEKE